MIDESLEKQKLRLSFTLHISYYLFNCLEFILLKYLKRLKTEFIF